MSDWTVHFATTRYGFEYGSAHVERLASHNGHVVIGVRTPKQYMEIRVTPTGLLRVSDVHKNDWRADAAAALDRICAETEKGE